MQDNSPLSLSELSSTQVEEGCALACAVREKFGYDFVGVSLVSSGDNPELAWQCAAGNTNNRYRRIILPSKVGLLGTMFATKRSMVIHHVEQDIERRDLYQYPIIAAEGLSSLLAFPLFQGEHVARMLVCAFRSELRVTEEMLAQTQQFTAEITGLSFESTSPIISRNTATEPVYTEVTHKILQAQENERKRVARELHDGLAQEILLVQIELRKLKYLSDDQKDTAIKHASEKLRDVLTHVSEIATGLRPAALDELGLATAIAAHCTLLEQSFGVQIAVQAATLPPLDEDLETALYRIFQEAITNACKYSQTDRIEVTLLQNNQGVSLCVTDHGRGFDLKAAKQRSGSLGLEGMHERAELIGGTLTVDSTLHTGTTVRVEAPLRRKAPGFQEGGAR